MQNLDGDTIGDTHGGNSGSRLGSEELIRHVHSSVSILQGLVRIPALDQLIDLTNLSAKRLNAAMDCEMIEDKR